MTVIIMTHTIEVMISSVFHEIRLFTNNLPSAHMEKEGLMRSVEFFNQNNIKIKTLVTDRHTSIRKWVFLLLSLSGSLVCKTI
jgi:hypothetical protein